jgi:hypothetical protein
VSTDPAKPYYSIEASRPSEASKPQQQQNGLIYFLENIYAQLETRRIERVVVVYGYVTDAYSE